jgi:hypothetical protein
VPFTWSYYTAFILILKRDCHRRVHERLQNNAQEWLLWWKILFTVIFVRTLMDATITGTLQNQKKHCSKIFDVVPLRDRPVPVFGPPFPTVMIFVQGYIPLPYRYLTVTVLLSVTDRPPTTDRSPPLTTVLYSKRHQSDI